MKLVVMSDTHLSRVTDEFRTICEQYCQDADMVIHLGDMTRSPVLDYLEQYPVQAVAGNMDDHRLHDRLPVKKLLTVGAFRIGLIHGWGPPGDLQKRLAGQFSGVDAVFFGHTHQALVLEEGGCLWFNPGSVFDGRGPSRGSIGVVHVEERLRGEIVSF